MKHPTALERDIEVAYDLALRSRSERDPERVKPEDLAAMRFGAGAPIVAEWRCRYPGPKGDAPPCRVMVHVDSEAVDSLAMFNGMLASRGEEPIGTHEVMVCDAHKQLIAEYVANAMPAKQARRATEMRDAIQKLKASNTPRRERELIDAVTKLHHPDVEGLLATLEEKLGGKSKRGAL